MTEFEKRVEEVDSDDEQPPPLVEANNAATTPDDSKQSRGEKKVRKQIEKLGLIHVPAINRVTMKKSKNMLFVIGTPDAYKSPTADMYVIFGECKIADTSRQAQAMQQAAQQQQYTAPDVAKMPQTQQNTTTTTDDDEPVDETGVEAKDIELVMGQAGCTRSQAVKALKSNDNDIVNAIMELTM
eukprot:TRINITY_DN21804_c0_g1_i1.p1 TRINITY_DN21804_c0_g1~~TRINITY_DN21804_c0_g1_i1.p1  ORF type:complete len:184 (+),score=43.40 TRINITY_DN21804_c0_g1_i1:53-604(+)